jgi:DtxR family Mn-dependent transcriptional regulator
MVDYKIIILIIFLLAFLLWVFLPGKGIYYKIKKSKLNKERILLEDALKFIFDCEYKDNICTLESISDNLQIDTKDAEELVGRLENLGLTGENPKEIKLTSQGKEYAVKIIRIHRIWERYLAEETGMDEINWHKEADKVEHFITPDMANAIASKLGNPVYDPHGDPIPTEKGEIPVYRGKELNEFDEGDSLIITHLEDEPPVIYSQLVAMGLFPGMHIFILEKDRSKIKILIDNEERILANAIAESVTVIAAHKKIKQKKYNRLSDLKLGETAVVTGISPASRGMERRRFMDLGIVPGTKITPLLVSPGGDPVAYDILDTEIAFRKKQAEKILVKKVS